MSRQRCRMLTERHDRLGSSLAHERDCGLSDNATLRERRQSAARQSKPARKRTAKPEHARRLPLSCSILSLSRLPLLKPGVRIGLLASRNVRQIRYLSLDRWRGRRCGNGSWLRKSRQRCLGKRRKRCLIVRAGRLPAADVDMHRGLLSCRVWRLRRVLQTTQVAEKLAPHLQRSLEAGGERGTVARTGTLRELPEHAQRVARERRTSLQPLRCLVHVERAVRQVVLIGRLRLLERRCALELAVQVTVERCIGILRLNLAGGNHLTQTSDLIANAVQRAKRLLADT